MKKRSTKSFYKFLLENLSYDDAKKLFNFNNDDFTDKDVESKYKQLALLNHPDRLGGSTEKMSNINQAKTILHSIRNNIKKKDSFYDDFDDDDFENDHEDIDNILYNIFKSKSLIKEVRSTVDEIINNLNNINPETLDINKELKKISDTLQSAICEYICDELMIIYDEDSYTDIINKNVHQFVIDVIGRYHNLTKDNFVDKCTNYLNDFKRYIKDGIDIDFNWQLRG